jgi:hypothetical protein
MRPVAKLFLSIDQRLYDIFGIVLIGMAANIIIGSAGRDDEYELLLFGLACIASGGIAMFLRSKRASVENTADAKRLINEEATSTKAALVAAGSPVPKDVERRACAATNSRGKDIGNEIDDVLAMWWDTALVLVAFIAATTLAFVGIKGTIGRLFVPANASVRQVIESAVSANQKKTASEIKLLKEDISSLSSMLASNHALTDKSIAGLQEAVMHKLNAIEVDLATLSSCISNSAAVSASVPVAAEQTRKEGEEVPEKLSQKTTNVLNTATRAPERSMSPETP